KLPPRPKRQGPAPRSRREALSVLCLARASRLLSQCPDQPFDLLVEQDAEFLQLGPAKRREKRRGAVVADDGAVFAAIENGDTKRHVEARANIDGDDLVGDQWIADATLHLAGERSQHALIGARDNHEAM